MSSTDLKFFTNEPERDLYSRFSAILKSNTQFFDVLVGYFRTSGFFKMYEAIPSEYLKSQIVTLNENGNKRGMHIKKMPYAFTEQGIYMLATLIHSILH